MPRKTEFVITRSEAAVLIDWLPTWMAESPVLSGPERDTLDDLHTYLVEQFGFDPGVAPRVIAPRSAAAVPPESATDRSADSAPTAR